MTCPAALAWPANAKASPVKTKTAFIQNSWNPCAETPVRSLRRATLQRNRDCPRGVSVNDVKVGAFVAEREDFDEQDRRPLERTRHFLADGRCADRQLRALRSTWLDADHLGTIADRPRRQARGGARGQARARRRRGPRGG